MGALSLAAGPPCSPVALSLAAGPPCSPSAISLAAGPPCSPFAISLAAGPPAPPQPSARPRLPLPAAQQWKQYQTALLTPFTHTWWPIASPPIDPLPLSPAVEATCGAILGRVRRSLHHRAPGGPSGRQGRGARADAGCGRQAAAAQGRSLHHSSEGTPPPRELMLGVDDKLLQRKVSHIRVEGHPPTRPHQSGGAPPHLPSHPRPDLWLKRQDAAARVTVCLGRSLFSGYPWVRSAAGDSRDSGRSHCEHRSDATPCMRPPTPHCTPTPVAIHPVPTAGPQHPSCRCC